MSSKNKKYYRENFFTGHPMDDEEYAKYNHTKRLVLRILRWAERAKTDKSGQSWVMGEQFKQDLHAAVVYDNYEHSQIGLSAVEKREANRLWRRYSKLSRLTRIDKSTVQWDSVPYEWISEGNWDG